MSLLHLVACTPSVLAVTLTFKKHKHNVALDTLGKQVVTTWSVWQSLVLIAGSHGPSSVKL